MVCDFSIETRFRTSQAWSGNSTCSTSTLLSNGSMTGGASAASRMVFQDGYATTTKWTVTSLCALWLCWRLVTDILIEQSAIAQGTTISAKLGMRKFFGFGAKITMKATFKNQQSTRYLLCFSRYLTRWLVFDWSSQLFYAGWLSQRVRTHIIQSEELSVHWIGKWPWCP